MDAHDQDERNLDSSQEAGVEGAVAEDPHGPERDARRQALLDRFDPEWPGIKFGMEMSSFAEAAPLAPGAKELEDEPGRPVESVATVAFWLEPYDAKAWAARCMLRCPALVDRFPWTMESALAGLPADEGRPRPQAKPMDLGEWQAMACLMWMMHPIYEGHDVAKAMHPDEDGRFAPVHALQKPGSPAHGDEPGSGAYFRVVFDWRGVGEQGEALAKMGLAACLSTRDALAGAGALDASRWLAESTPREQRWPARRSAYKEMEAIVRLSEAWERLDISRSAALSGVAAPSRRL